MSILQLVPITELAEIRDDLRKPINNSERNKRIAGKGHDELFPYYGATGQVGWIDSYITDGEYVLVGEDGAPFLDFGRNKAYIISGKTWVNNHAHILKAKDGQSNNRFICHYLNYFNYDGFVNGTTRLKLTKGSLQQIPIPKFEPNRQKKIADKIDSLFTEIDSGSEELKKAKQKLELYKQSVLNAAIQGKLVPQDPKGEPASKLLERIRAEKEALIKNKKLKKEKPLPLIEPSEVPFELPKGWEWVKLAEIIIDGPTNGYSPRGVNRETKSMVLTLSSTTSGRYKPEYFKYFEDEKDLDADLWLKRNDILIQRGNTIEYVGVAAIVDSDEPRVYPDLMIRVRVSKFINPEFIVAMLNSQFSRDYVQANATGAQASMPKINQGTVLNWLLPLPSQHIQNLIMQKLSEAEDGLIKTKANIEKMQSQQASLRHSILKSAFEGKLI